MKNYTRKLPIRAQKITPEWFDGDHPNPLHDPFSGLAISTNPKKRTVNWDGVFKEGDYLIIDEHGLVSGCEGDVFEKHHEVIGDL